MLNRGAKWSCHPTRMKTFSGPWRSSHGRSQAVDTSPPMYNTTTLGEGLGCHIFRRDSCLLFSSPCMALLVLH